ncbi:bifunctional glutamate N-acetyltransferase/amino-acid acetyltransferase ArgJ [Methylophilaceae bacterium]|nr:bifunctional glutamate N-acetyltransferase/amino-acid acetyltransferase ArgJ [Methylophilaceae bacterium]
MAINLKETTKKDIKNIKGLRLGVANAGIKDSASDLLVISLPPNCSVAGVFTQNQFCAAPVLISQDNLAVKDDIRALIINSGCANAGMGQQGIDDAKEVCKSLAKHLDINEKQVLPFSTGLIMSKLPVEKITKAIPNALNDLNENNWLEAAESIMTTDTIPKAYSKIINLKDRVVTITGISKGSGMIYPNMATMLAFIAIDINIPSNLLKELIGEICEKSFNCISVDGDTSTNDSFILMSIPLDKSFVLKKNSDDYQKVKAAIFDVATFLAQSIIRDGEGATKFITICVNKALSHEEAKKVGMSIANSPLVKTAFFASDANLGRVLSAIGNSKVNDLDLNEIDIYINEILFCNAGAISNSFDEIKITSEMKKDEIKLHISLGRGTEEATIWTTDLSYKYIEINSEYRT